MKKKAKKYTNEELADAHIFPPSLSEEEIRLADTQFSAFRAEQLKSRSEEDRYYARLMQLKYMMEDYIEKEGYNEEYTFGFFLREYIHSLNKSKGDFSEEISLHYTKLSRLLNDRDEPNEKILVRLEMHSGNAIPAILWYRLLEKQKELFLMNDLQLREAESKYVKKRLGFMND